jgi:uncharacterized protein (TIGR02118 family)
MIRVAVLYANSVGRSFDVDYYKQKHMALVWEKLGPLGMKGCEVDAGVTPVNGERQPYAAIGYLFFETAAQFDAAFAQAGEELIADVPNYTNIEPVIQVSDYERIAPGS